MPACRRSGSGDPKQLRNVFARSGVGGHATPGRAGGGLRFVTSSGDESASDGFLLDSTAGQLAGPALCVEYVLHRSRFGGSPSTTSGGGSHRRHRRDIRLTERPFQ
ncbi:hypothetical protein DIQ79_07380 [Mycolicibacterium smegmatis]|uniref:Uncharacterized protein n=1 Tax=Mycolicibacterium smegmatis (strain ATCC 700084 / mc(2)155) TaxID=246196 RepID=A0QZ67_MYCS2|nr:hypothetical protein MSMEG_3916 [Mycolicibacterium smegmatis MC2 155]TBM52013.1 hypothetical protein DIQ86_04330 [Mycolicibacterium smegmatis]TBH50373.1 hypothetical protein EYS45_05350 [Mycolicibacterium smegmatis MC2 155]TBM53744.1 hypothetical protein DIQ85_06815 [Mycolicibacterium smegmatis]TBM65381.1 hypothetical protein DIQ83_07380 [Mycolicibacterium smegmatis]